MDELSGADFAERERDNSVSSPIAVIHGYKWLRTVIGLEYGRVVALAYERFKQPLVAFSRDLPRSFHFTTSGAHTTVLCTCLEVLL
jgi:hypothetical protein